MKKKILISISIFIFVVTGVIFNYPRAIAVTEDVNISDINSDGFYYEQLTSELARSIYNGILSDVSGTGKFVVDTNLSFKVEGVTTENQDDELQELYDEKISPDLHDSFCAFILDHPEYYWIRYNGIDGTITPDFLYNMNEKIQLIANRIFQDVFEGNINNSAYQNDMADIVFENNGIDSIASSEFKKIAESSHAIVYIQSGKSFDMNNVKTFFYKFEFAKWINILFN